MDDLLKTALRGGCSVKLSPELLEGLLRDLKVKPNSDKNLLVGNDTHDDAAVYKINDEQAIIFTTDFFPPMCADPFTFGQIAAANALSDVYAMGGNVLIALNLIMFPISDMSLDTLSEILKGGADKVAEAGGMIVGGHTIDDTSVKYGLAVVGLCHPEKVITNAGASVGDVLILTKPIGTGTMIVGHRLDKITPEQYKKTLQSMALLNKQASVIMNKYGIKCATDITGFGLLGHSLKLAKASNVCLKIDLDSVPLLDGVLDLAKEGCVPGASFRNQKFVEGLVPSIVVSPNDNDVYQKTMLLYDAQTSGGILMCVPQADALDILKELKHTYHDVAIIGQVEPYDKDYIVIKG